MYVVYVCSSATDRVCGGTSQRTEVCGGTSQETKICGGTSQRQKYAAGFLREKVMRRNFSATNICGGTSQGKSNAAGLLSDKNMRRDFSGRGCAPCPVPPTQERSVSSQIDNCAEVWGGQSNHQGLHGLRRRLSFVLSCVNLFVTPQKTDR